MKIRTGFVSNSSSSSFMIFGVNFTEEEDGDFLRELPGVKEAIAEDTKDGVEEEYLSEYIYSLKFPEGFKMSIHVDGENQEFFVGSDPREWPEDMTVGEAKAKTTEVLKEIFGEDYDISPEWIKEVIYN